MIIGLLFKKLKKIEEIQDQRIVELDSKIESELCGLFHVEHGIMTDTIIGRKFNSQKDFLDWVNNVADLILKRSQISIGVDINDRN